MSNQNTITFEEIYSQPSKNGLTRPKSVRGEGYKMVNMGELFANPRIDASVQMERVKMSSNEISKYALMEGDLLFARQSLVAEGAGRCSIINSLDELTTFESHLIRVRLDKAKANPWFYFYYFQSYIGKNKTQSLVNQVAAAGIRGSELARLQIDYPDKNVQDKIAFVCSLYDNLIENNNRRIAILEEMAQRLYREWFVHFRFPGHEHVEMVESELGMIPEGWRIENADEIISTQYGYTETANDKEIGPKYVRGTDINKTSFITWATVPYCQITDEKFGKYQLNVGDVLIIRMADPGKIGIIEKDIPAVFASYLIRLAPINKQLTPYYLFFMARHSPFQNFVLGASTGATRKSISAETIKEARILVPSMAVQELFDKRILPIRQMIILLLDKTENLRKTRDHLLPRLISGDIDVSKIDIPVEDVSQ